MDIATPSPRKIASSSSPSPSKSKKKKRKFKFTPSGTIRGVRASSLGHHHFLSPAANPSTFRLSEPTNHIDEFFSHSSASNGTLKWLSLRLYHNGFVAVVASVAVGVLAVLAELLGMLVLFPATRRCCFDGYVRAVSPGPYVAAYGTFLVMLFFGSSLRLGRRRDPMMFVDKICIEQTDPERKQFAIGHIAEFIRCSSKLVICYGDEKYGQSYFQRLWCLFELSAFMKKERRWTINVHPIRNRVTMLPLSRSLSLLLLQLCLVATHTYEYLSLIDGKAHTAIGDESECHSAETSSSFLRQLFEEFMACMLIPFCFDVMEIQREGRILEEMRTFTFDAAKCRDAKDRKLIRLAVEEVYDGLEEGGDKFDGALKLFERDIRYGASHTAVEDALNRHPIGVLGRWHAIWAFLPYVYHGLSYLPATALSGANFSLFYIVGLTALSPLCRVACLRLYKWRMRRLPTILGSVLASAIFAALMAAVSVPAMMSFGLLPAPLWAPGLPWGFYRSIVVPLSNAFTAFYYRLRHIRHVIVAFFATLLHPL